MTQHSLIEDLCEVDFLQDVEQAFLEKIAEVAEVVDYEDDRIVFREGDPAESVYLIVRGGVSLEMCAPGSGCQRILTLHPGDLLGWSAILQQERLTACARTSGVTRLVRVHAGLLLTLCDHNPRFGYEIMRRTSLSLAKRLQITRIQLLDLYGGPLPPFSESPSRGGEDAD